jgi:hypothetical protein
LGGWLRAAAEMTPVLFLLVLAASAASGEEQPPTPDPAVPAALAALLRRVDAELHLLQVETNDAALRGRDVYLERASLEVGRYYRNVSESDASNASMTQLLGHYRFFYADAPPGFADARALSLPLREANDTLALLQRARAALAASPTRPRLPSRDVRAATVCDGYLCNSAGQPVIPTGFNVWAFPKSTGPFAEAVAGINVVTTGLGVDRLQANLTIEPDFVEQLRAELDAAAAKNISVHTLGFGSVPRWAEKKVRRLHGGLCSLRPMFPSSHNFRAEPGVVPRWQWPGIISGNFSQHGVKFDISSPGVPILMRAGIEQIFATGLGCHPALRGFILGNEVSFMHSGTPAMLKSYRGWLQQRYDRQQQGGGGIRRLNAAWGTSFESFEDIPGQPTKPQGPVTRGGQAAEWLDWNTFNNGRVTAMYSLMATAIRDAAAADPRCANRPPPMTTLKLQDGNEFNGLRAKGIDRSALVSVLTFNGCDSGIASNRGLDSRGQLNPKARVMNRTQGQPPALCLWRNSGAIFPRTQ